MIYQEYLQSAHWKETREKKLLNRPLCQICREPENLHIHHKFYENYGKSILGEEKITNLVTLCSSCHRLVHFYFGIGVKKLNKKFCRVRRLMELGVKKNKSFWIVSTQGMWEAIYPELLKKHLVLS